MERRKGEGRGKRSGYPLTLDIVVESWGKIPGREAVDGQIPIAA